MNCPLFEAFLTPADLDTLALHSDNTVILRDVAKLRGGKAPCEYLA